MPTMTFDPLRPGCLNLHAHLAALHAASPTRGVDHVLCHGGHTLACWTMELSGGSYEIAAPDPTDADRHGVCRHVMVGEVFADGSVEWTPAWARLSVPVAASTQEA
jgi:hypothetical protein